MRSKTFLVSKSLRRCFAGLCQRGLAFYSWYRKKSSIYPVWGLENFLDFAGFICRSTDETAWSISQRNAHWQPNCLGQNTEISLTSQRKQNRRESISKDNHEKQLNWSNYTSYATKYLLLYRLVYLDILWKMKGFPQKVYCRKQRVYSNWQIYCLEYLYIPPGFSIE